MCIANLPTDTHVKTKSFPGLSLCSYTSLFTHHTKTPFLCVVWTKLCNTQVPFSTLGVLFRDSADIKTIQYTVHATLECYSINLTIKISKCSVRVVMSLHHCRHRHHHRHRHRHWWSTNAKQQSLLIYIEDTDSEYAFLMHAQCVGRRRRWWRHDEGGNAIMHRTTMSMYSEYYVLCTTTRVLQYSSTVLGVHYLKYSQSSTGIYTVVVYALSFRTVLQ